MRLLIYWVISAIALIVSAFVASALDFDITLDLEPWWRIMVGVAILGLINATIGTLAKAITLPLNCLTFGIAWLLINAALFYYVGTLQPPWGFRVGDFWSALVGSMLMGIVLGLLRRFADNDERTA
jgi:putative membrane protein